jgi:hypothetical protein
MAKNNIVPFIKLKDYFDNVAMSNMGDWTGDCKICKTKQIRIFEHPCWNIVREESKKLWEKENATSATIDKPTIPVPPVDDDGKAPC